MRGFVFSHRHRVTGHEVETRSVLRNPFFKPVGVELFDILGDLRETQASLVFVGGVSAIFATSAAAVVIADWSAARLRVEVVQAHVAVRLDHNGSAALRLRPDPVGKPLLDDEGEFVIRISLRKQVANECGLPRAGHAEQDRKLRVPERKLRTPIRL